MPKQSTPPDSKRAQTGRAAYEAPRLIVHGTVASMTEAQPSNPRAISELVEAEITFLGRNV